MSDKYVFLKIPQNLQQLHNKNFGKTTTAVRARQKIP